MNGDKEAEIPVSPESVYSLAVNKNSKSNKVRIIYILIYIYLLFILMYICLLFILIYMYLLFILIYICFCILLHGRGSIVVRAHASLAEGLPFESDSMP